MVLTLLIDYAIGLLLSGLSKHANHGNNPGLSFTIARKKSLLTPDIVWPMLDNRTGGYNWLGLALTVAALAELSTRPLVPSAKQLARNISVSSFTDCLPAALPLGSLIFSLHCFLTDPSTIIAWTWTGYPVSGPVPHIHGSLTLIAQAIGVLLPAMGLRSALESPAWFAFGATSAYTLYAYKDWIGYCGGLGLAVFLMSIIPHLIAATPSNGTVGNFYFLTFLVTIALYLANVWTVAYAFVPAGDLLRERTDM